jgi:Spy/CpxP family protein refolding chaperone
MKHMKRMTALAIAAAALLVTTAAAHADRPDSQQAPRGQDVQAPRM